jgi:hypothetical protein
MVVLEAAAYSPSHRSKIYLVYTTEDLRVRFVDRTHFFGRVHLEKRAYPLPIGKVGLGRRMAKSRDICREQSLAIIRGKAGAA